MKKSNWKTTLLGILFALFTAWGGLDLDNPFSPKSIFTLVISGGMAICGYLMKDDILKKR